MGKLVAVLVCVLVAGIAGLIIYVLYQKNRAEEDRDAAIRASTQAYKAMAEEEKRHVDGITEEPGGIDSSMLMHRDALRRSRADRLAREDDDLDG